MTVYRNIITVFLEYRGKVLLMKRGLHKEIAPGLWSSIAGHIEPEEINHPYKTCMREIKEETGIREENIEELNLKYIIFNKLDKEIVINHMFFGRVNTNKVVANDEGDLYWVEKERVAEKIHIPAIRVAIEDYYKNPSQDILLAIAKDEEPYIIWHLL